MIPLIDLSRGRAEVADALAATLEHVGFFIVVNHGVSRELVRRAFAEAERFHAQSPRRNGSTHSRRKPSARC